jgi:hypothetical protein
MYRVPLAVALVIAAFVPLAVPALPSATAAVPSSEFSSREQILSWMLRYRAKPAPAHVPAAIAAASRFGAFRDTDGAGVYVGFMAGALAATPAKAEDLAAKMTALPAEEHWAVVRAVAYSGLPQWKALLSKLAPRMPTRKVMIDRYVAGMLPTLDEFAFADDPGVFGKIREALVFGKKPPKRRVFEPHPDLVDTFWGWYFATGSYAPVARLVAMLPWSKERDNPEKLVLGSMAKLTLGLNATRDAPLLELLKWTKTQQPKDIAAVLEDVIEAAETADTPRIRKEALAAIEELKRKGPAFKRDVSLWGQVGQGALSLGCIGAAALGQVEFGLPCVLGGALSSGLLYYWDRQ